VAWQFLVCVQLIRIDHYKVRGALEKEQINSFVRLRVGKEKLKSVTKGGYIGLSSNWLTGMII